MTQRTHRRLGEILLEQGAIDDDVLASALASQAGLEHVDPRAVRVEDAAVSTLSHEDATALGCLPIAVEDNGRVALVVADPFRADRGDLERRVGAPVQFLVGSPSALQLAIDSAYTERQSETLPTEGVPAPDAPEDTSLPIEGDDEPAAADSLWAVEPVDDEEAPPAVSAEPAVSLDLPADGISSLAELTSSLRPDSDANDGQPLVLGLIAGTLQWQADGLRLEWADGAVSVSYNLDGVWRALVRLPGWTAGVVGAALRTALGRSEDVPLEELSGARIDGQTADRTVRFVVSTARQQGSDRVTLHVRDPQRLVRLEQVGMSVDTARRLRQWTAARQGLLLVVGTHGSGRTNLIRGIADQVAAYRTVAQVLADPVGRPAGTWTERGANDHEGADAVLRAIDADPKVLVVDDCDGHSTALAAFRASLQDRLVVAALRGRDAAEALQRLRDEGLSDLLLGDQLVGVIETRLIRLLCRSCWVRGPLDADLAGSLGLVTDTMPSEVPKAGAGCPACHHTGYHGRRALVSRVELDGGVQDGSSPEELRQAVTMNRPRTVAEAGLGLVVQGLTSIEELARVIAPRPRAARLAPAAPAVKPAQADAAAEPKTLDEPDGEPAEAAAEAAPTPAAEPGPVVSVASPEWSQDASEETVADSPAPTDEDDEPDSLDLGDLVGFDEEADGDDRHLIVVIDPREELPVGLAGALPEEEFRVVGLGTLDDAMSFVRGELPTAVALTAGWHFDAAGAIRALRDDLSSAFLPLLVVAEDDDSNVELLRAGADEVLPSSVPPEELELRLRAVIRRVT